MAQKLHDQYGYSYDTLKVLLGGWHAWQNSNYPMAAATPGIGTVVPPIGAGTAAPAITP